MKTVNVKKSPAVLGLSKKSKDSLKTKKKSKLSLSTPKKNVLSKHLLDSQSNSDKKGNVKNADIKNSPKFSLNSPKATLKDKKKNTKKITNSPKISKKDNKKNLKKKKFTGPKGEKKNTQPKTIDSNNSKKHPVSLQNVDYIDRNKVIPPVKALLTHCKTKNKNALFKSEGTPIFVQFETIAVPKHFKTTLRLILPHSTHSKVADVLLIITDEKKHHRKLRHDDDMYIFNFTEKLKELGVTQVSKVMTLRQIRAEYYTHEMRRKLCDMYDVFLVDGKLGPKLSSLIGGNFFKLRKTPIPVSLEKEDKIKLEIERGLRKTQIVLKSTSCTNSVCTIGNTDMKAEEIAENLEAFSKGLDSCKYPGGWRNIKSIHIKTPTSTAFPVYYSFVTPNEIENAELKQTLPKHCVAVKGELSTIGRDVTVRPDGTIEVEGVDNMRSLMHDLYRHAGFKDNEDLDLTDAEYKEVVRELQKHIPVKPKPEDRHVPSEQDVSDLLDNNASESEAGDSSSDEDDNTIRGEIQREDNVHGDFEDNREDEEEEEKGDEVEQSYMQQWQETWLNQSSEDEEERETGAEKGKKKPHKNVKNQSKKSAIKNQPAQGKTNNKRKQKTNEEGQESKKQRTAEKVGKQDGKKADRQNVKKADKQGVKKADKQSVKKADKQSVKKADKQSLKKADKERKSKKDTPLRQASGVGIEKAGNDSVVQKKKAKKSGSKTPNYIPL